MSVGADGEERAPLGVSIAKGLYILVGVRPRIFRLRVCGVPAGVSTLSSRRCLRVRPVSLCQKIEIDPSPLMCFFTRIYLREIVDADAQLLQSSRDFVGARAQDASGGRRAHVGDLEATDAELAPHFP